MMHNHFDRNLNVKEMILERRPRVIVECGAASGENTRQLLSLLAVYPFKLYCVTDSPYCEETMHLRSEFPNLNGSFEWMYNLSYKFLDSYQGEIGLLSIDTDHNYWTLMKELNAAADKIVPGGLIVMHDTETYRKNSGKAFHYGTGDMYPCADIDACEKRGLMMGDAILDFLHDRHDYRIFREVTSSHGATALERSLA